jgi:hypothetical protein
MLRDKARGTMDTNEMTAEAEEKEEVKEEEKEEEKEGVEASLPLNNMTPTKEINIQVEEALEALAEVAAETTILIMISHKKRDALIKGIMTTMMELQQVALWEEAEGTLTVAISMIGHLSSKAEVVTRTKREDAIMMIIIFHQNSKHKRSGTSKITVRHKIVEMDLIETLMKEASVVEEAVEAHLSRAPIEVRAIEETLILLEEEVEDVLTMSLLITILVVETPEEEALVISKEDKVEVQVLMVCKDKKAEDFIIQ